MRNLIIIHRNPVSLALRKVLSLLAEDKQILWADKLSAHPQDSTGYILAGVEPKQAIRDIAAVRTKNRAWRGIIFYIGYNVQDAQWIGTPFNLFPDHHMLLDIPLDIGDLIARLNSSGGKAVYMIDNRSQTYFNLIKDAGEGPLPFQDMLFCLDHSLRHLEEDLIRGNPPGLNWFKTVKHISGLLHWDERFAGEDTAVMARMEFDHFLLQADRYLDVVRALVNRLSSEQIV